MIDPCTFQTTKKMQSFLFIGQNPQQTESSFKTSSLHHDLCRDTLLSGDATKSK
jgi:hypothetical protein